MPDYEKEYHQHLHKYLEENPEYYGVRSRLALKKYFNNISKESKILEFGCGMGQNISLLPNAVGYDISKYSLAFCKSKGIAVVENLSKVKNESFDMVFSSHVLEHVDNPLEVIKQMKQKLKRGGKFILVLPVDRQRYPPNFKLEVSQHLYAWTFSSINNLLMKNGFKIESNKFLRGEGYMKLLPIHRISPWLFEFLTKVVAYIRDTKEMKIVATKL